jgi:hypothetical protein
MAKRCGGSWTSGPRNGGGRRKVAMIETQPASESMATELQSLARLIAARGLAAPAVFFLELHRPLAFLSSQFMLVGSPVLAGLLGLERLERLRTVLADQQQYEQFLTLIETAAADQAREG